MSRLSVLFILVCLTEYVRAQSMLRVQIGNLDGKKGVIYLAVYNSAENYMDPGKTCVSKRVPVSGLNSTILELGSLPNGRYAIVLFLDENGNGKIDKNMMGIPKERYGFSGTKRPLFRAPYFEEAAVYLSGGDQLVGVSLR